MCQTLHFALAVGQCRNALSEKRITGFSVRGETHIGPLDRLKG
jgi:hypothetical protein